MNSLCIVYPHLLLFLNCTEIAFRKKSLQGQYGQEKHLQLPINSFNEHMELKATHMFLS